MEGTSKAVQLVTLSSQGDEGGEGIEGGAGGEVHKVSGAGPSLIAPCAVAKFLKYDSGAKEGGADDGGGSCGGGGSDGSGGGESNGAAAAVEGRQSTWREASGRVQGSRDAYQIGDATRSALRWVAGVRGSGSS